MDKSNFTNKCSIIHNYKYNYDKVIYKNNQTNIEIICPDHGSFWKRATRHLHGGGCPRCTSKKMSTVEFIGKANNIHDGRYKYDFTEYIGCNNKVEIICPEHGSFSQTPSSHLRGRGCQKCANNKKSNIDEFITKANAVHDGKYNYSMVTYNNSKTKVKIVCKKHGIFEQSPNAHLKYGCKKCANENPDNFYHVKPETLGRFIEKSIKIHGNKYDYSKSNYINCYIELEIICPKHGSFWQIPTSHYIQKYGCPRCSSSISNGHQEIVEFLESIDVNSRSNDRKQIHPYELDIWIKSDFLAIEYHGLYYHSYDKLESVAEKVRHQHKANMASDKGILLIQVFEDEWMNKKELVKSMIKSKIRKSKVIFARKCKIEEVPNDEYLEFCKNHIQGYKSAKYKYGLYHNRELTFVMSFNRKKESCEIERLCSKMDIVVVGGASKLFKRFIHDHNPDMVISYCDRRFGNGGVYKKLGMELVKTTKPNYFYVKNNVRYSRMRFQKHKLRDSLAIFDSNLTEAQNMFNNGYRRIWDAGHYKFVYQQKTKA